MKKSRTITSFINDEQRQFSRYVCYHRAIPALIDGFKPSLRKAFFILKNKNEFVKVQAIAGRMISDANYNHGDASASDTISRMAQNFTGSNNIPVFIGKGSFGSKFVKDASAPRYIYSKANKAYYDLFKDYELCEADEDIENPEPRFYLPIIPTLLLNGIEGIAVGFACKVQPYNIKDIIENVNRSMDGLSQTTMTPFFNGYTGKIKFEEDLGKFVQYGTYKVVNTTTIHISEVPICYDSEKYNKFLDKLIEKDMIVSYRDESKSQWNVTIKLKRKSRVFDDPIKYLGLSFNLNENITLIDENGQLRVYNSVNEVIDSFVEYRLGIYQRRIDYMLNTIKTEVLLSKAKIKFIIEIMKFNFQKDSKEKIKRYFLDKMQFTEDHLEKCLGMSITRLNKDTLKELKNRLLQLKEDWNFYKTTTPKTLFKIDLENIK